MKIVKVEFTVEELLLLATLASDQLFRREFIDPKMPGYKGTRLSWGWARTWLSACGRSPEKPRDRRPAPSRGALPAIFPGARTDSQMPFDRFTPQSPEQGPVQQLETSRRHGRDDMSDSPTQRSGEKAAKTQYILTGFSQTAAIRLYAFEGIGGGRRVDYTVEVDLSLIPNYGIRIQDLPLLCRELLQKRVESSEISALTFTAHEMCEHAEKLAAEREESARRKNAGRRPVNANPGSGWRAPLR